MFAGNVLAQQLPYQNPALSAHERAVDLCGRLTLEEKASLMLDDSPAIPRLGIKRFQWWSEALHGVANMGDVTVFPEPIGMAASFNDRMVYRVFDATSDEMRAKWNELQQKGGDVTRFHALSVWTPNVNIFRDPRWGRGQETYGEDPYRQYYRCYTARPLGNLYACLQITGAGCQGARGDVCLSALG